MESHRPFAAAPKMLTHYDKCGIGKFKNIPLKDVPTTFFQWMHESEKLSPRVWRGHQWVQVMIYLRHHKIILP